jgi:hypothetical protein
MQKNNKFLDKNFSNKTLTNPYKALHRNEQTHTHTRKISYLDSEEFHTPHALSLKKFIYAKT